MLKSYVVELPDFPNWYRWDFVYCDEHHDLIFTTYGHYPTGVMARVSEDHGFLIMKVFDAERMIGVISTRMNDGAERKDNNE